MLTPGPPSPGIIAGGLIAILLLASCSQNIEKLDPDEPIPPGPPSLAQQMGLPPGAAPAEPNPGDAPDGTGGEASGLNRGIAPGITGSVQLEGELAERMQAGAVLYLIAREPGGGAIAARRVPDPVFPVRFFLGQESVMMEGGSMEGQVDLIAHLSQTGSAGTPAPGDVTGKCPDNPITVGNSSVFTIVLDTLH